MDKLYIDNKEVEMGGEVGIYLTYRSNIMSPDISKILGNNSNTIKIPHTLHNASIIENAQMVQSQTKFPYLQHTADVERDGVMIIRRATVILLKTTPTEYEVSLVWGASEGMRRLAEDNEKLSVLAEDNEQRLAWSYNSIGTLSFPEAQYGFIRAIDNGKYWYHPVIPVLDIIEAIAQRYETEIFFFNQDIYEKMRNLCVPILTSTTPEETAMFEKQGQGSSTIEWDNISDTEYNRWDTIRKDNVVLRKIDIDITAYGYLLRDEKIVMDSFYLGVLRTYTTEQGETETDEILQIPCTSFTNDDGIYGSYRYLGFKYSIEDDIETFNAGDKISFTFRSYPVSDDTRPYNPFVVTIYYPSSASMTFSQSSIKLGDDYYLWRNLPDIEILKFLKGIMQMFGLYAYVDKDNRITLMDYPTFFSRKAQAQDWSDYLCMIATDASDEQEFTPEGFFQNNLLQYKNDDANKGMDSSFHVDNETLEAEGEYITLPFDSVEAQTYIEDSQYIESGDGVKIELVKIPLYKQTNEDAENWNPVTEQTESNPKQAYILRRTQYGDGGYYLNREGLDWASLMQTYYAGIIESIQQAHYITATFYLDAVVLQGIDFGAPVYIRQYASYFAIIEIKTKANNLAEVKLLKIV